MKIPIFRTSNYCNRKYGVTTRDCGPKAPCDGAVYAGPLPNVTAAYRFEVKIDSLEDLISLEKKVGKVADKWCEAVPKWIPVTERLPEKRGWYLANVFSLGVRWGEITTEDSEWIQLVFYHEGKFHKLTGSNVKVTHWMPLPEPPDDPKLSATIKCGGAVTCAVAYSEEVYGKYTDTAGNLHWTGTHSGEHIIPAEEGET